MCCHASGHEWARRATITLVKAARPRPVRGWCWCAGTSDAEAGQFGGGAHQPASHLVMTQQSFSISQDNAILNAQPMRYWRTSAGLLATITLTEGLS